MDKSMLFSWLVSWFKRAQVSLKPSIHLPGKWKLFEYYTETDGNLVNIKEQQIKRDGQYLEVEFLPGGIMEQAANIPVRFFSGSSICRWQVSRNYIILINAECQSKRDELQFAIDRGELKILKKDSTGKIEFFGFFRKEE